MEVMVRRSLDFPLTLSAQSELMLGSDFWPELHAGGKLDIQGPVRIVFGAEKSNRGRKCFFPFLLHDLMKSTMV